MNEQLVVKNFGPFGEKGADVTFKKVTIFIGPTGGGKSTLAKLAAILFGGQVKISNNLLTIDNGLIQYNISNYKTLDSFIQWTKASGDNFTVDRPLSLGKAEENANGELSEEFIDDLVSRLAKQSKLGAMAKGAIKDAVINQLVGAHLNSRLPGSSEPYLVSYIPTERVFAPAIEYSWAGLMRDDIGLPKTLLEFANSFSLSRKEISELEIPFLNVKYLHIDGRDFIKIPEREEPLMLLEAASGIQSVTPLLVLLEYLSRNTEQAQSFIIEEPELNLYPTAQQGLLNWLVEKCTKGENDLTITTHSPYILSSCNLLLEAYKVAQQRPELADEIDKIVPRAYWLNPEEFAAYYVADGTVKPITDTRTHLIGGNELDAVSGDISDSFRRLLQLKKQVA